MLALTTPWTFEPEYVSAERKQTTGYFLIRDKNERFVCKVHGEDVATFIIEACNRWPRESEAEAEGKIWCEKCGAYHKEKIS